MVGRSTRHGPLGARDETILVRANRPLYDALMKHLKLLILIVTGWTFVLAALLPMPTQAAQDWFEDFKDRAARPGIGGSHLAGNDFIPQHNEAGRRFGTGTVLAPGAQSAPGFIAGILFSLTRNPGSMR